MKLAPLLIALILLGVSTAFSIAAAPTADTDSRAKSSELLAAAEMAASTITDPDERDDALMRVIHARSAIGDVAAAKQTAKLLGTDLKRAFASRAIASGYARSGDIKTAMAMADALPQASSGIFEEVVAAQIERGDLAAAKTTRARIREPLYAAHADRRIAVAQAASGDLAAAKQTIDSIQGAADVKVQGYLDVADSLRKQKNDGGVREMMLLAMAASREVPEYLQPMSAAAIAGMLVKTGNAEIALNAANRISQPRDKALILSHIAEAQAEIGDLAGVRATAKLLAGDDQVRLQLTLAKAQAMSGDSIGAKQSIATAKATADRIEIPTLRAFAYESILSAQVELGDAAVAVETAKSQKDPIIKTYSLVAVAQALTKK